VEHALANLLPVVAGPLLVRASLLTTWIWLVIATFITLNSHAGVQVPFCPSPWAHDLHHALLTVNYGAIGLMDWLFETAA
jgi:sterol desaturase/sphingolipid hydroxylase (fatty acid hydroxylase superfamily)